MVVSQPCFALKKTNGLNNMGCVPRVKLGFAKITALLTNFSYYEL
jgi:hypothetical protein